MNRKLKHWLIIFFLVCSIFSGLLVTDVTDTAVAAWWDSDWSYYKEIIIESDYIDKNLWNFPLLVTIPDEVGDKCNDGDSIRFLSTDNVTEFKYEIEKWVDGSDRIVWVNISETITADSDYKFLMYYSNGAAADNQTATGVWDSNYNAVYHMGEASGNIQDSTVNNYDATASSGTPDYSKTGNTGNAIFYYGGTALSDESHTIPEAVLTNAQADAGYTIEFWFNSSGLTADYYEIIDLSDDTQIILDVNNNSGVWNFLHHTYNGGSQKLYGTQIIGDGIWYYFTATFNGSGKAAYTNSTDLQTAAEADINSEGQSNKIGANYLNHWGANADLDEIRISKKCRNWSWINASYHSQNQTSGFLTFGSETIQAATPTNFTTTTLSITSINVSWTIGTNTTHTRIQRKTGGYPTSITDGTNIYNGTGIYHTDTSLTSYTRIYYSAWGYNSTTGDWSGVINSFNNTGPTNPGSVTGTVIDNDLNISWTMGSYANATVIQRKTDSYPTSITDGTNIYNDTDLYYVDTNVLQTYFYTLYSWDNNTDLHSSGVNLEWGALDINCYDENTTEALTFNVFITDEGGSQTYEDTGCTNTHRINLNDLPIGDDILIQISTNETADVSTVEYFTGYSTNQNGTITYLQLERKPTNIIDVNVTCYNASGNESYPVFLLSGTTITIYPDTADVFTQINVTYTFTQQQYVSRNYYMDLVVNTMYTLNAYLSNATHLYLLRVVDENAIPLEDVELRIMRYINETAGYENISIILTGTNGEVDVYLIAEQLYKIRFSKTNYVTKYENYVPDPTYYGLYYPKTFTIVTEVVNITTETFADIIVFNGAWVLTNNTLNVNFIDKEDATDDVTFSVYEVYNDTSTLTNRSVFGSISTATLYYYSLNISRMHRVDIEMNHTTLGHVTNQSIFIGPIRNDSRVNETWLEEKIEAVFGEFDQGYVNFFMAFLPCVVLIISLGAVGQPGFGVTGAALYLFLLSWRVNLNNEHVLAIASIMLLFGIIIIIAKHGKKLTGKG